MAYVDINPCKKKLSGEAWKYVGLAVLAVVTGVVVYLALTAY